MGVGLLLEVLSIEQQVVWVIASNLLDLIASDFYKLWQPS